MLKLKKKLSNMEWDWIIWVCLEILEGVYNLMVFYVCVLILGFWISVLFVMFIILYFGRMFNIVLGMVSIFLYFM